MILVLGSVNLPKQCPHASVDGISGKTPSQHHSLLIQENYHHSFSHGLQDLSEKHPVRVPGKLPAARARLFFFSDKGGEEQWCPLLTSD